MLLCEGGILTCSALILRWQMAVEGFEDMAVYTVLCAVSTFSALAINLSLLFVPTQVCLLDEFCA